MPVLAEGVDNAGPGGIFLERSRNEATPTWGGEVRWFGFV